MGVGVNVAEYNASEPLKLLKVPPVTSTELALKVVEDSLSTNDNVAVCPAFKLLVELNTNTVGGVVSGAVALAEACSAVLATAAPPTPNIMVVPGTRSTARNALDHEVATVGAGAAGAAKDALAGSAIAVLALGAATVEASIPTSKRATLATQGAVS